MNSLKWLSISIIAFLIIQFSCTPTISNKTSFNPISDVIASLKFGKLSLYQPEILLKRSILKTNENIKSISTFTFDGSNDNWYLIGEGISIDSKKISIAIPLRVKGKMAFYDSERFKHACENNCCDACFFVRDPSSDDIVGCHKCGESVSPENCHEEEISTKPWCGHTISTAKALVPVKL